MILVQVHGNAFGLLHGERAMVDETDTEVARGIGLGVLRPVDQSTGEVVPLAVVEPRSGGCSGCGG